MNVRPFLVSLLVFLSSFALRAGPEANLQFLKKKVLAATAEYGREEKVAAMVTVVDELEGGALSSLLPEFDEMNHLLVIHLKITPKGLEDWLVVTENAHRLNHMTSPSVPGTPTTLTFDTPFTWAETVNNARAGSLRARESLLRMEALVAKEVSEKIASGAVAVDSETAKLASEKLARAEKELALATKAAKVEAREKKTAWEKRKTSFAALEADEVKLDDLIMKNDRKGVRKLLDAYLPWELMEPVEVKNWEKWLEAIENPDKAGSVLVFRGLDVNPYLKPREAGVPGLLSSVLIRNQGNYTRRLRSLTTLREKIGLPRKTDKKIVTDQVPHLTTMMSRHAIDPYGSPFISVSDYTVAKTFGRDELSAIMIDPRRLAPNMLGLPTERELLVPLIIFPDEIVHYQDLRKEKVDFLAQVEAKLGRKLTSKEYGSYGFEIEKKFSDRSMDSLPGLLGEEKKKCPALLSTLNHLLQ